ncbi:hypothetical protein GTA08_BOTSDO09752 [Neofusicoccum parvum]|uniref:Uncharacterized protein n=1 Tax=Neofusicoccum parvum TaxID=310453 RepID=A0ACB5RW37_9PEZI|nr:hypothetical protein GTA08_BOTSDO09752 [Neofusicoccum parvum]
MAQSTRQPRQTRSSAACDSCRSKKQKCGGEWPTCARCRETGNECTWPPQLQRGPAKGYLEAIEARLDDVEHILLQVLPLVPPDQLLSSVTCLNDSAAPVVDSNQKRTTQEKRAALDYWASFPLNSPDAVLTWCRDRLSRDTARRPQQRGPSSMDLSSAPGDQSSDTPGSTQPQLTEVVMEDASRHRPDSAGTMAGSWPAQNLSYGAGGPDPPSGNTPEAPPRAPTHISGQSPGIAQQMQGPPSIASSGSSSRFDLSDEFHAKFLW